MHTQSTIYYMQGPENFPTESYRNYYPNVAKNAAIVSMSTQFGKYPKTYEKIQDAFYHMANAIREKRGKKPYPVPVKFLDALRTMPPAAGIAFGVDRLIMLLTGTDKIDDVVSFTPEEL
jgi:hypothetical protein